jgi:excisionase family DNA binding protein
MDLTVNEVAERLNVTPLTVRRWLNAGALSGMQLGDRAGCRITEYHDRVKVSYAGCG